jgi:hypothetical protein
VIFHGDRGVNTCRATTVTASPSWACGNRSGAPESVGTTRSPKHSGGVRAGPGRAAIRVLWEKSLTNAPAFEQEQPLPTLASMTSHSPLPHHQMVPAPSGNSSAPGYVSSTNPSSSHPLPEPMTTVINRLLATAKTKEVTGHRANGRFPSNQARLHQRQCATDRSAGSLSRFPGHGDVQVRGNGSGSRSPSPSASNGSTNAADTARSGSSHQARSKPTATVTIRSSPRSEPDNRASTKPGARQHQAE